MSVVSLDLSGVVPVDQTAELEWCETHKIAWRKADHWGCPMCQDRRQFVAVAKAPDFQDEVAVRARVMGVQQGMSCGRAYQLLFCTADDGVQRLWIPADQLLVVLGK